MTQYKSKEGHSSASQGQNTMSLFWWAHLLPGVSPLSTHLLLSGKTLRHTHVISVFSSSRQFCVSLCGSPTHGMCGRLASTQMTRHCRSTKEHLRPLIQQALQANGLDRWSGFKTFRAPKPCMMNNVVAGSSAQTKGWLMVRSSQVGNIAIYAFTSWTHMNGTKKLYIR